MSTAESKGGSAKGGSAKGSSARGHRRHAEIRDSPRADSGEWRGKRWSTGGVLEDGNELNELNDSMGSI